MEELWAGKRFKDIVEEDTKYFASEPYRTSFEECMEHIEKYNPIIKFPYKEGKINDFTIMSTDGLVMIAKAGKLWGFFVVYEYHGCILHEERNLVCAHGHEDICLLWLDNLEYQRHHTR